MFEKLDKAVVVVVRFAGTREKFQLALVIPRSNGSALVKYFDREVVVPVKELAAVLPCTYQNLKKACVMECARDNCAQLQVKVTDYDEVRSHPPLATAYFSTPCRHAMVLISHHVLRHCSVVL